MLSDLSFSLNRTGPFFLLMVLGFFLRRKRPESQPFFEGANGFVYSVALPASLFMSIAQPAGEETVSGGFLLFTFLSTLGSFLAIWSITELVFKDKTLVGTLVQGGFRGNFALLGLPLVTAVAGEAASQKAAFAMVAVIPLYNMLSVVILMLRGNAPDRPSVLLILKGVVTNRLILAIACGLPFFFFHIPIPHVVGSTLSMIGQTATPLGLLSIGGLFRVEDATARLKPALYAALFKNLLLPGVMLPLSFALGFRGNDILVLFILFATPVAISSYPMSCALGGDGPLASNILILTTFLSAFVFAGGIYFMRVVGWI